MAVLSHMVTLVTVAVKVMSMDDAYLTARRLRHFKFYCSTLNVLNTQHLYNLSYLLIHISTLR